MWDRVRELSTHEAVDLMDDRQALVVIYDQSTDSDLLRAQVIRQTAMLDDRSEFWLVLVSETHPELDLRLVPRHLPAMHHFSFGRLIETVTGLDDCLEFFQEFIIVNRVRHATNQRSFM
jgi:hypothetical protein